MGQSKSEDNWVRSFRSRFVTTHPIEGGGTDSFIHLEHSDDVKILEAFISKLTKETEDRVREETIKKIKIMVQIKNKRSSRIKRKTEGKIPQQINHGAKLRVTNELVNELDQMLEAMPTKKKGEG